MLFWNSLLLVHVYRIQTAQADEFRGDITQDLVKVDLESRDPDIYFASGKSLNVEKKFARWPRRSHIPYALHSSYSPIEVSLIKSAIAQIMSDTNFWITLVNIPVSSSEYKILITPLKVDNFAPEEVCYSYPGMLTIAPQLAGRGIREQRLVLARGPTGCMDGTIHSLMRHLVVVLGKRNEHERGDRDQYIEIQRENLSPAGESAFRLYTPNEAIWNVFPYDYCSITHASQTDFAQPGKISFTVLQPPFFIPKLNRLSETDCRLLLLLYEGDPSACATCLRLTGGTTTTETPSTTTQAPTSTTKMATTESTTNGITTVCYSFPTSTMPASTSASTFTSTTSTTSSTVTSAQNKEAAVTEASSTQMTTPKPKRTKSKTRTTTSTTTTQITGDEEDQVEEKAVTQPAFLERGESINGACGDSFCDLPIDHASLYWDGNTSILFSGNCTQRIDSNFQFIGSPTWIGDALPGSLIYGTIQAAWTNLQEGKFRLHIVDKQGVQRVCSATACIREEQTARLSPSSSLFLVQAGQSQTFRMFSLDGSLNIIDMMRQQSPIAIRSVNSETRDEDLVRIDTAWMFYKGNSNNTVAVIGSDQTGRKYIGEAEVDLTKIPATFRFTSAPVPVNRKFHPCPTSSSSLSDKLEATVNEK